MKQSITMNLLKNRNLWTILIIAFPIISSGQETEKGKLSVNLHAGTGNTINGFRSSDYNGFSFYGITNQFTYGLDVSYFLSDKHRIRVGAGYIQKYYGSKWPVSYDMDYTRVTLYGYELSLNFDYKIYQKGNFQLFASPGLIGEFVVEADYQNFLDNGDSNYKLYNIYPQDEYPSENVGLNLSMISKYKLTNWCGLTLTPYYNVFLKSYTDSNAYQRFGVSLGAEFTF
nr:outer membrane beta-barrel protein [uncultured Carboxylicivirga sp.]